MKHTKQELKNAILLIAESYSLKINFEKIIESESNSLPKVIELIIYKMFLNEFDSRSCEKNIYESYKIILEYSKELNSNGFVDFKN